MTESHNSPGADGPSTRGLQLANGQDLQSRFSQDSTTSKPSQIRLVPWRVPDLKPHPSYDHLHIKIPASRLNELLERGEDAFLFPLIVTSSGIVIDGYARLEVARLQGRTAVECVEYNISEEEALRRFLLCHRPAPGLPPFSRIAMARGLTKSFKEKALQHQQAGGKEKGSSKLAESERIDVRKEIAAVAGVSVGILSPRARSAQEWRSRNPARAVQWRDQDR